MKRVIIVYNPRSSRYELVKKEVLERVRRLEGFVVGKYEVKPSSVDENAEELAKILLDGDIVMTAGGDGTAAIGFNGAILSKKNVKFAALPYGNFNDLARSLDLKNIDDVLNGKIVNWYPLEVLVDGRHWRYVACYVTIGLFAESTKIFDQKKVRQHLRKSRIGRFIYSIFELAKWYFKNRKRQFIPEFSLNGEKMSDNVTDYLAVNSKTMARVMKGKKSFLNAKNFESGTAKLGNFWHLCWFMIRSIFKHVPTMTENYDVLKFKNGANIEIQAEGEYKYFEGVKTVEIRKYDQPICAILKA